MAIQYSEDVRNAQLDAFETTIGTSPILALFTGSMPANTTVANSGTLVASMTLPSDWMAAASGGTKAKSGTWEDTSADSAGTVGYFRIFASGGTCHMQGTVANSAADMIMDNNVVGAGQSITVSTFSITRNNA